VQEELRKLLCRSLLFEALRLLHTQILQTGYLLQVELAARRDSIEPHANRLATLNDKVVELWNAKVNCFHQPGDSPELQEVMEGLGRIIVDLQSSVIDPLLTLAALPESSLHEQDAKREAFARMKEQKPWVAIVRRCKDALDLLNPYYTAAVDDFRFAQVPMRRLPIPCKVFIASTSETKEIAAAVVNYLNTAAPGDQYDAWDESRLFEPGRSIFEALENVLQDYHIGVALFGPTDSYQVRNEVIPLCNVVLEFGMFSGRFGRTRAIPVFPGTAIPGIGDLKGILGVSYGTDQAGQIAEIAGKAILKAIQRERLSH
jgi:predicted nucleotide-binding protein